MLTLNAPAKINLTLEVLGKRDDGFHEIRSVIQTVNLLDSIRFILTEDTKITSDSPGWEGNESLVSRTIDLIRQETGYAGGVTIEIIKRIPLLSGLGGDSADAAIVLRGLNRLWMLNFSEGELTSLAARLGSDVPFFLNGGTALLEGRGEIVRPLPAASLDWILLALPPVARQTGKTARLYESLQPLHYTGGEYTAQLLEALKHGSPDSSLLFNTFENIAFGLFPGLTDSREDFISAGARIVRLAGSGPVLFTLMKDKSSAEQMAARLVEQRMETYLVRALPTMENII